MSIQTFIEQMPKVELHVHLEGAIAPATLLTLAARHGKVLPADTVEGLQAWYQFTTFRHFINIYLTTQDCIRTADDFAYVVYAFAADRARQNIRYTEATVTPYTHIWQGKGLHPADIIEGLEEGRRQAWRDFGIELRWIFDIPRNLPEPAGTWTADYAIAHMDRGVVGFGLGGDEARAAPELWVEPFQRAVAAGLYSVPHAGEVAGPASVWGAICALGARRIGHGVRSIEDPALVSYLVDTQIPLEVNPTSNLCLNVYPNFAAHPLRTLWDAGVYVTVNSDDPPMFNTSLTQEYQVLHDHFAFTAAELETAALRALQAAAPLGLDAARKHTLVQLFQQAFADLHSEPGVPVRPTHHA